MERRVSVELGHHQGVLDDVHDLRLDDAFAESSVRSKGGLRGVGKCWFGYPGDAQSGQVPVISTV
jgi:hypothetical protein